MNRGRKLNFFEVPNGFVTKESRLPGTGRVSESLNLSLLLSHYLELSEWTLIEINMKAKLNEREPDIVYLRRMFVKRPDFFFFFSTAALW